MKRKIIVIGGLAAGPAAASKAARTDPNAEVILFEQSEHISFGLCEIPYFIGNKIHPAEELILYTPQKLKTEKNVDAKINHSVREIIPSKKQISVYDSANEKLDTYKYDKIIICTGSSPKPHPNFDNKSKNVFYIKTLSSAIDLKNFIEYNQPKKAVIFGAGFIGLEMADALNNIGIDTTILGISDPLPNFEPELRSVASDLIKRSNIKFQKYEKLINVDHNNNLVTKITTDIGSFGTDLVICAIGIKSNNFLARSCGINLGNFGGILVDQKMQTSISNIFAAGDCCEFKNLITNKYFYSPFATTAQKSGWAAGENSAGGNSIIKGLIPAYTITFLEREFAHVGLSFDEATKNNFKAGKEVLDAYSRPKIYPGASKITTILIYDKSDGKLLGAELFGKDGAALRANILSTAIYQKMTIKDLLNLDFVYNPPTTPTRDPILFTAAQALKKLK